MSLGLPWWLRQLKKKNMSVIQETWVQSMNGEYPPEKEMATLSSIIDWNIPLTEEPDGLKSTWSQRVRNDWAINTFTFT